MYAEAPFRPSRFLRLAVLAEEGHWHHAHGWNSEGILREVATCTGHHFVHSVLRRLGADQRVCAAIPRVVSSERHANGLPRAPGNAEKKAHDEQVLIAADSRNQKGWHRHGHRLP